MGKSDGRKRRDYVNIFVNAAYFTRVRVLLVDGGFHWALCGTRQDRHFFCEPTEPFD